MIHSHELLVSSDAVQASTQEHVQMLQQVARDTRSWDCAAVQAGSPPAVILGEVGAVLPDLGPAFCLEALDHGVLFRCWLGYELQQLLAPA